MIVAMGKTQLVIKIIIVFSMGLLKGCATLFYFMADFTFGAQALIHDNLTNTRVYAYINNNNNY